MADVDVAHPQKTCSKCKVNYPATREFFFAAKLGAYGLKAICKRCAVGYNKEWQRVEYTRNREKVLAAGRATRARLGEAYLASERERQQRRGSRAEAHKRWSDENRETVRQQKRAAELRRRAAKRLVPHATPTVDEILQLKLQQGDRCFYCCSSLSAYHVDHFVPLAKGGSNQAGNLVIACPPCNLTKGSKLPWEWKPDRFTENCLPY